MLMTAPQTATNRKVHAFAADDIRRGEADHRIANNLALIVSLVRMRARAVVQKTGSMQRDEVRVLLEDIAGRIDTVARLHRMLSRPSRQIFVNLPDYLEEICASLTSSLMPGGRVQFSHDSDASCVLSPDQVLTLGLLVSELVTNSVKYAHPSGVALKISVGCRTDADGALILDFSDDGIGLPEDFDPKIDGGLGLRLVRSLSDQLGATMSIDSDGLGTRFRLKMPVALTGIAAE
jgi:two-component sensor histidine kinase